MRLSVMESNSVPMKADNHLHPFESHSSKNGMRQYAKRANELGFNIITFTEHCPLPPGFGEHGMTEYKLEEMVDYVRQGFPEQMRTISIYVKDRYVYPYESFKDETYYYLSYY